MIDFGTIYTEGIPASGNWQAQRVLGQAEIDKIKNKASNEELFIGKVRIESTNYEADPLEVKTLLSLTGNGINDYMYVAGYCGLSGLFTFAIYVDRDVAENSFVMAMMQ